MTDFEVPGNCLDKRETIGHIGTGQTSGLFALRAILIMHQLRPPTESVVVVGWSG